MHLKSYQIDGQLLRTAAADFSASGLIDRAEHEIDMAAYVLTDWPVKIDPVNRARSLDISEKQRRFVRSVVRR